MEYRCLACGSTDGEPAGNGSVNWFWRILEYNRVGPFCRQSHATAFCLASSLPTFTLIEWERLHFLKWRVLCGELTDMPHIAAEL